MTTSEAPAAATGFSNLADLFDMSCRAHGRDLGVGLWLEGSGWWWVSHGEYLTFVEAFAGGLARLGVGPGDRVAVVSRNRLEWAVACHAIACRGAVLVAVPAECPEDELGRALSGGGVKVAIGGTLGIVEALGRVAGLAHVVGLDLPEGDPLSYRALLDAGRRRPARLEAPAPTDAAAVIHPTGRVVTHAEMLASAAAVRDGVGLERGDRALTLLPFAGVAGQSVLHATVSTGSLLVIDPGVTPLDATLAEVKPTIVFAPEARLEACSAHVEQGVRSRPLLVRPFARRGLAAEGRRRRGVPLKWIDQRLAGFAERLLPPPLRVPLDARFRCAVGGAPPLDPRVASLADTLGVRVVPLPQ